LLCTTQTLHDAQPTRAINMHDSRHTNAGGTGGDGPLVVNLDKALERLDQDRSLFNEMAGFFLTDSPGLVETIHAMRASREQEEFARAAHTLKNLAATCGGERAANAAAKVEQLGLAGAWDSVEPSIAALEAELATLSERLRGLAWES
jgi:HPt (histidine-containing phosphotransfer) domain-containing protein